MATSVTFNGQTFSIPANREPKGWGTSLSSFLVEVANSSLSKAGGTFTLTADANFGSSYGFVVKYIKSVSSNISTTGVLRLANNEGIGFRNAANSADKLLKVDASDKLAFGSSAVSEAEFGYVAGVTSAIQTQLDAKASTSALTAHESDTSTHGVGVIVGTTESQELTNKTITDAIIDNGVRLNHETSVTTPASGKVALFAKDDDKLYLTNSSGVTSPVSASGTGEKNYITNPSGASSTTGWANVGDLDIARTTTAGDLPREYTTATGLKITADSNTQSTADYVYYDFTLDDVDLNKKLKIEWSQKQTGSYVASNLAVVITTQADRTTALHTPVTTNIPAVDGVFTTSFDAGSTATLSLVIRATTDMATDAGIVISDVVVGPGTIVQGAAVSEWQTYTPTLTNGGTTSTNTGRWRRVGSTMEIETYSVFTGAGSASAFSIGLPTGYSVDTSALPAGTNVPTQPLGIMNFNNTSTVTYYSAYFQSSTTPNSLKFIASGGSSAFLGNALANTYEVGMQAKVPIAEWAGNGTVNLGPGAQVEYAYNSSTSNSDDTTSFAYGPSGGSLIGSTPTAGGCTKRVRFQYPIQSDDLIVLEVSPNGDGKWFQLPTMDSGAFPLENLHQESTEYFGLGIYQTAGLANNEIAVKFGRYPDSHTTDSSGYTWSQLTAYKWRIRKCKASAPVGFGLAGTDGSSGLYKAGQAPGLTTGAAVATGYIGEVVTSASITATALSTSYANITNASLTLSAGIWQICYSISLQPFPGSTVGNETLGSVQLYNSTGGSAIASSQRTVAARNPASASFYVMGTAAYSTTVNISSATTYTIQGKRTDAAGTGSCQLLNSSDYTSSFYAVRIA